MKLTFLGAAREVTGSSYLVETDDVRFLVDCGMFQGGRETREKNRRAFHFDPRSIDFVLLTHAHIDHSGLLPRLVALGFRGSIFTTRATCDLLAVMLPDSAHIQEKEAEHANLNRFRKDFYRREQARGLPLRDTAPLYTVAQAQASLKQLNPVDYDLEIAPHPQVRCTFRDAGHILGSAIVEVWVGKARAGARSCFPATSVSPRGRCFATPRTSTMLIIWWLNRPTATVTTRAWKRRRTNWCMRSTTPLKERAVTSSFRPLR